MFYICIVADRFALYLYASCVLWCCSVQIFMAKFYFIVVHGTIRGICSLYWYLSCRCTRYWHVFCYIYLMHNAIHICGAVLWINQLVVLCCNYYCIYKVTTTGYYPVVCKQIMRVLSQSSVNYLYVCVCKCYCTNWATTSAFVVRFLSNW